MEITHSLSLFSSPSHPMDSGGSLFALPQQLFQEKSVGILGDISDLNGKKVEEEEGAGEDTDSAQLRSVSGVSVQRRSSFEEEEGAGEDTDSAQLRSVSGVSVQRRSSFDTPGELLRQTSFETFSASDLSNLFSDLSEEHDTEKDPERNKAPHRGKDGADSKEKSTFNIIPPLAVGKHSNGFRIRFTVPPSHDSFLEDAKDDHDFIGLYLISSSVRVEHFVLLVALSLA